MLGQISQACPHLPEFLLLEEKYFSENTQLDPSDNNNKLAWHLAGRVTYGLEGKSADELQDTSVSSSGKHMTLSEGTEIPYFQKNIGFQYIFDGNSCTRKYHTPNDFEHSSKELRDSIESIKDFNFRSRGHFSYLSVTCLSEGLCSIAFNESPYGDENRRLFETAQKGSNLFLRQIPWESTARFLPVDTFLAEGNYLTFNDPESLLSHVQDPSAMPQLSSLLLPTACVLGAGLLIAAAAKMFFTSNKKSV